MLALACALNQPPPPRAVKYFCNEKFELAGYDNATRQYQVGRGGEGRGERPREGAGKDSKGK